MRPEFPEEQRALTDKMLKKRLWAILTRTHSSAEEVKKNIAAHLNHQIELEKKGILFGAGPLADPDGKLAGFGLILIRADSEEEARRIADSDPMHKNGLRTYTLHQWCLNEGRINITLNFSDQTYSLD
ncbi:MAG: YciI family protein [Steroidobacteraceae bacterium]